MKRSPGPSGLEFFMLCVIIIGLQGCVAGTVIDVVAETVEAGVELTGAVIGTAVDVIIPDGDDEDDDK